VVSAALLVQARRRAGLSQRALAERAGLAQQEIARYERGRVTPSLERLRALIAAGGLELMFGLARADDSYDGQILAALAVPPGVRLQRALRDAGTLRAARASRVGASAPPAVDALGLLRALAGVAVEYVLVGELAEVLHGSPLLPVSGAVTIVPRAGQSERLGAVIAAGGGQPTGTRARSLLDAPASFALENYGVELVVAPAPVATHGYQDLHRDATPVRIEDDLTVMVASLVDLVRIADASQDRGPVPALWRTLELATTRPAARVA
jgi:DNA-binding XRE family transcriptional regulator